MTPDDLDALLARLPDDAVVTVGVGDLRRIIDEHRQAADVEIAAWMDAVR